MYRISNVKVEAADTLYRRVTGWVLADSTLDFMRETDLGNVIVGHVDAKVLVLNTLYRTRLRATNKMARHIVTCIHEGKETNDDLVEAICRLNLQGRTIHFRSFAAKFCHFFIDPDEYSVMDRYNVRHPNPFNNPAEWRTDPAKLCDLANLEADYHTMCYLPVTFMPSHYWATL